MTRCGVVASWASPVVVNASDNRMMVKKRRVEDFFICSSWVRSVYFLNCHSEARQREESAVVLPQADSSPAGRLGMTNLERGTSCCLLIVIPKRGSIAQGICCG